MKKSKYNMTEAARVARHKGGAVTSKKFAAIRKAKSDGEPVAVVRVSKSLKNWAVQKYGNVDLALKAFRASGKGVR